MSGLINVLLDVVAIVGLIAIVLLILSLIGGLLCIVISLIKDEIEFWKWERESEDDI